MTAELSGSAALVTGGTSGIGRAAAVALAGLGAHVAVSGRDKARGDQVVQDIRTAGGKAVFLAPDMAARGNGAIINLTTMVAEFGMAEMSLYGSSKAALVLLTKSWAAEYGPRGVRVNAVSPGPTRTEGTAAMGESLDALAAAGPAGRPGYAEEIADAITYLATDRASFVHGAILPVDGGRIAV